MRVSPEEKKIIEDILRFYLPDREVWAFGSRVMGQRVKPFSDLDLAVLGSTPLPVKEWARVKDAFELSALPFRVDVLDWAEVSPEFRKIIEQHYEVVQTGPQENNHAE